MQTSTIPVPREIDNMITYGRIYKMKKLLGILVLGLLLSGNAYAYDSTKYYKCYGEMTTAHKARGLHKSNRPLSIKIKETVCKAYANGEIDSYEGKE